DAKEEVWVRQHEQLLEDGCLDDYGALVYSAFVTTVRRRFSPTWTQASVIRFVADVRAALAEEPGAINPVAGENLIRRALGDTVRDDIDQETKARTQLMLLDALIAEAGLDGAGLDQLLSEARMMADQLVS